MKERNKNRLMKAGILAMLLGLSGGTASLSEAATAVTLINTGGPQSGNVDYGWTKEDHDVQVYLENSAAYGYENIIGPKDGGSGSTAIGVQNEIWNSSGASAVGKGNYVDYGDYTSAVGYENRVIGGSSAVFGKQNTLSGGSTTVIGISNKVYGDLLSVMGSDNTVGNQGTTTTGAFVMGTQNSTEQSNSVALGFQNTINGSSLSGGAAIGIKNYVANISSAAIGFMSSATGGDSYAIGTGFSSVDAGGNELIGGTHTLRNLASGTHATAVGWANNATGAGAIAIGSAVAGSSVTNGTTTLVAGDGRKENIQNTASGTGSIAVGVANQAEGASSVAIGDSNVASAKNALAIGGFVGTYSTGENGTANQAVAENTVAVGLSNYVGGVNAISMGSQNVTSSSYALMFGNKNRVGVQNGSGNYAQAIGAENTAIGTRSLAYGYKNTSNSLDSVTIGAGNQATGVGAIAIGAGDLATNAETVYQRANGSHVLAIGYQNNATGDQTQAIGAQNAVYGTASIAYGTQNVVGSEPTKNTVEGAIAVGRYNSALGTGAIAIGTGTAAQKQWAEGANSIAIGNTNIASKDNSFALGSHNYATAENSMALGGANQTEASNSITFGLQNVVFGADSANGTTTAQYSMAQGINNAVFGTNSFAVGNSNKIGTTGSSQKDFAAVQTTNNTMTFGVANTVSTGTTNIVTAGTAAVTNGRSSFASFVAVLDAYAHQLPTSEIIIEFMNKVYQIDQLTDTDNAKVERFNAAYQAALAHIDAMPAGDDKTALQTALNQLVQWEGAGIVMGQNNTVTGARSQAFGVNNTVNAVGGVAIGGGNLVGDDSTDDTRDYMAVAIGAMNQVRGNLSIALGAVNTIATKEGVAIGLNNTVGQITSIALGSNITVSGTAMPGDQDAEFGYVTAIGAQISVGGFAGQSVAIGGKNTIAGSNAVALGYGAEAQAVKAEALGAAAVAQGKNSVALGYGSQTTAEQSDVVSVGTADATRKVINVTYGADTHEASTWGQIAKENQEISFDNTESATSLAAGDVDGTTGTKAQTNVLLANDGTVLATFKKGTVTDGDTGFISGGDVYTYVNNQALEKNQTVSLKNTTAPTEGNPDTRTNVIKDNAGNVIATFEAGEVAKDNAGFVSGGQVWSADVKAGQMINGTNNTIVDNAGKTLVTIETADAGAVDKTGNKYITEQYYYTTIENLVNQNSIVDYDKQYGTTEGDHWLSTDFGKADVTHGKDSTAYGYNANATADNSVAIGAGSVATEVNTFSVGGGTDTTNRRIVNVANGTANSDAATYGQILAKQDVTITKTNNTAVLKDNAGNEVITITVNDWVDPDPGSSIVNYSTVKHWLSTDFDKTFDKKGEGSTAYGYGANARGDGSVALGQGAVAEGTGSIAIGKDSLASGDNEVSFGHKATDIDPTTGQPYGTDLNRKLTNVADGTANSDAATFGQIAAKDQTVSLENTTAPAAGAADTRTNIIKDNAGNVIATFQAGQVAENNTGFVSGGQVWSADVKAGQMINGTNNTIVDNAGKTLATIETADAANPDKTGNKYITEQYYYNTIENLVTQNSIVDYDKAYATSNDHWLSTDFDQKFDTKGKDSTAYGYKANAQGDNSVAIGAGSIATAANTFSVGSVGNERQIVNVAAGKTLTDAANYGQILKANQTVTITTANNTGYLYDNAGNKLAEIVVNMDPVPTPTPTKSIVNYSDNKHWLSTDFDQTFETKGEGSVAYGYGANAKGDGSVALGQGAVAEGTGSIAIGKDSVATGENEVSFGNDTTKRKLTNVADGTANSDAATFGQIAQKDQTVSLKNTTAPTEGATDTRTNIIKDNAGNVIATFEAGEVAKDNTGFVSGGQVWSKIAAEGQAIDGTNNVIKANDGTALATIKVADATKTDEENKGAFITKQYYDQSVTNIINKKTIVDFNEDYATSDNHWLSTDFGATDVKHGKDSTAYGYNANAQADNSVAIGSGSIATEDYTFSVGGGTDTTNRRIVNVANGTANTDAATYGQIMQADQTVTISADKNTGYLYDNAGNKLATIVVNDLGGLGGSSPVQKSEDQKWLSTDFDLNLNKKGEGSTAYGYGANAQGTGSVAIGKDSLATDDNEVSFGHKATDINPATGAAYGTDLNRKLTNVADGTANSDAATFGQIAAKDQTVSLKNTTAPAAGATDTRTNIIKDNAGNVIATFEAGEVAKDNAGFVSGGQVWNADVQAGQEISATNNQILANDGTILATIKVADPNKTDTENAGAFITKQYYDNSVTNIINQKTIVDFDEKYTESNDHWLSTDFGKADVTHGKDSTAYGYNANAQADNSVAIGAGSVATEVNTFSVGGGTADTNRRIVNVANGTANTDAATYGQILAKQDVTITKTNNTAVLKDNAGNEVITITVNDLGGEGGTSSVVNYSTEKHWLSTDFDKTFDKKGEGSTAYGYGANAQGDGSVALGKDAVAKGNGSVAIGEGSVAEGDNEVSFGTPDQKRKLTNVADGTANSDAATFGQIAAAGQTVSLANTEAPAEGAEDTRTNVIKDNAGNVIATFEAGQVAENNTGFVSGGQVWSKIAAEGQTIDATNNIIKANDGTALATIKVADATKTDEENKGAFITKQYYDNSVTNIINQKTIVDFDEKYAESDDHWLSTDFGATDVTHGKNSTAYGYGANAQAENSVAIGQGSVATVENTFSVGSAGNERKIVNVAKGEDSTDAATFGQILKAKQTITITDFNNSGILRDNDGNDLVEIVVNTSGTGGSSIVNYSTGSHWLSTDFDKSFQSKGEASTAYGYGANAAGNGSVALGQDAIAEGTGSVAIGQGSLSKNDNEVSFGHKAGDTYTYIDENNQVQTGTYESDQKRKLTNVADGTEASDAATFGQIVAKDQIIDATNNVIKDNNGNALVTIKVADPTKSDEENAGAFITKQYYDQSVTTIINQNSIVDFDKDYKTSGNHYLSTDFDNEGVQHGKDSTAYGYGSEAAGTQSTAIGYTNKVSSTSENSTAIGALNTVNGAHSIAAGCDNDVQGDYAVALGHGNKVTGNNAIVIGKDGAAGKDGIVIGNNSKAAEGSTAIGNDSVASGDKEVSFGHKATDINPSTGEAYGSDLNRKLTNIAAGEADNDAATVGQVKEQIQGIENKVDNVGSRISRVEDTMDKGIAGASALAALHPLEYDPDDKASFAVGYGHFKSADALAIGAFYRPNESVLFSLGGVFGNGEDQFNAGISFALGRDKDRKHPLGRIEMGRRIDTLLQQNETLRQENAGLNQRVDRLEQIIQELVASNSEQSIPTV